MILTTDKERLNNNFDFLRVFAALCITYTHSYNLLNRNDEEMLMRISNGRVDFSAVGLNIFFAISGYLIAKSALHSFSFKNYAWKRFLRIQPLLILVCILSIFVLGPLLTNLRAGDYFSDPQSYAYFRNILPLFGVQFNLPGVFLQNPAEPGVNGSLWTLISEERLYLFIGLLFLMRKHRKNFLIIAIALLNITYALNLSFFNGLLVPYLNGENVFYSLIFLNASAMYLLRINFKKKLPAFILFTLLSAGCYCFSEHLFLKSVMVIFIPAAVVAAGHLRGFLNHTGKYGDFTYGIYIFSFPVQQVLIVKMEIPSPLQLFIITLFCVVPAAIISWHFFEKRILSFKNSVR